MDNATDYDREGPVRMPLEGLGIGGCAALVVIYAAIGLIVVTIARALPFLMGWAQ